MRTAIAMIAAFAASVAANTVYATVDVTITSCPVQVSSCPGTSTYPTSIPVSVVLPSALSFNTSVINPGQSYPPTYPSVDLSSVIIPVQTQLPASPSSSVVYSSVVPYPTSVVTIVTSFQTPVGTGTSVVSPQNATSTQAPIATFTGAASSISGSYGGGLVAGLVAMAACLMA